MRMVLKNAVSLRAEAVIGSAGNITVEFDFKQIISGNGSSESEEGEREEQAAEVFEVASRLGLTAGRPSVAGAKRNDGDAMFLILYADF